jgi:Na+-transporting NADH:ubiquinone oxidoreductase subunit D
MSTNSRPLVEPLVAANPVTVHVLGICSALAVTTSLSTAMVMSAALIFVLICSNTIISAIRHHIPGSVRIVVQITIIASLVIVVDQVLQAYFFETSKRLSVFVGLIVSNCIVLGRAEAFAMKNSPGPSFRDGLGNGLGYAWVLLLIGALRELLVEGTLLGRAILPLVGEGGWFTPLQIMALPPGAFFLLGGLVWTVRTLRPNQQEALPDRDSEESRA